MARSTDRILESGNSEMAITEPLEIRARTKIVSTVGPACRSPEMLQKLVDAGVDVFRLNMAHGSFEEHAATIKALRAISEKGRPVAVLVDLAGPKIRLGELVDGQVDCKDDATFEFIRGDSSADASKLVSNYEKLVDELAIDDEVLLADGTVSMRVTDKSSDKIVCTVIQGGPIRSRQGINLPGAKLSLPTLTDRDKECAEWAAGQGVDFVSLSFVRSPDDIRELRAFLKEHGCHAPIIAKIEKPEAIDCLAEIVETTDAVMVARGDLGVEIDVADVPVVQKEIITKCNEMQKPVIVATQMLDSMHTASRPTRAEVTDVANAILDGADACMLSGETAIGDHPALVVETMNRIMISTERLLPNQPQRPPLRKANTGALPITHSVVYGAAKIAEHLDASLVVIATKSGATALTKSNQRDFVPTVAVSEDPEVLRRVCLYWGITPLPGAPLDDRLKLNEFVVAWGKKDGILSVGDCLVTVTGTGVAKGGHNLVVVDTVS